MSNHPHLRPPGPKANGAQPVTPIAWIDIVGVQMGSQETPQGRRILVELVTPVGTLRGQMEPSAAGKVAEKLSMLAKGLIPPS